MKQELRQQTEKADRFILIDSEGIEVCSFSSFEEFLRVKENQFEDTDFEDTDFEDADFEDANLMIDTFHEDLNPNGGFIDFIYLKNRQVKI